jgi:hypothetical protein
VRIKQSNEKTQKEFDNVKQRDQNNKLHQQNEQQKLTGLDLLVGFALNFINRAKLGITVVMIALSVFVIYHHTDTC